MEVKTYLVSSTNGQAYAETAPVPAAETDDALEDLIHSKSRLQARKLEILASELFWRLRTAAENVRSLETDSAVVRDMLNQFTIAANYGLREHQEKAPLYRRLFEIEAEHRAQKVECWRDMANVMRDFLTTWEAHEQARARAIFLNDVGTGTQEPLQETEAPGGQAG